MWSELSVQDGFIGVKISLVLDGENRVIELGARRFQPKHLFRRYTPWLTRFICSGLDGALFIPSWFQ